MYAGVDNDFASSSHMSTKYLKRKYKLAQRKRVNKGVLFSGKCVVLLMT